MNIKRDFPSWWISITNEIISQNKKINLVDIRITDLAHGNLDSNILINFEKQKKIDEKIILTIIKFGKLLKKMSSY